MYHRGSWTDLKHLAQPTAKGMVDLAELKVASVRVVQETNGQIQVVIEFEQNEKNVCPLSR